MKVNMYVVKVGGRERTACKFICSGCGKPIDDLARANFAPAEDDWAEHERNLVTDKLEIWHWDCDDAGTPWTNAADAFRHYFERERSMATASLRR